MALSVGAWATLAMASLILYGGSMYYVMLALHIKPREAFKRLNVGEAKRLWASGRKARIAILSCLVVVLIIVGMWASFSSQEVESGPPQVDGPDTNVTVPENFTYVTERALDASGTTTVASPTGVIYVDEPFDVRINATKLWVNLTGDIDVPLRDYDLQVLDPDGNEIGSSGNVGSTEQVVVEEKQMKRAGPGTFTARIVVFHGRAMSYQVTADVMYAIPANTTA